ncbi:ATP-dependent helicase [Planomonospora venezuelensis]|uniref:DNA 3'-5' helicase n=1 Tax=Planomonospora venezuelensis TaxID=1999 RepID=A0A841CY93_PLAVE|nr:ATP-dependent DNA helicase [Planomonospora venezuelensis]MBB5962941.1 DNA helicase-2/ATP-dependent DNA helicase PcrA [Planomonospora venezuelensis]GIN04558.1 ATP-dependent DNA helicase [Planomonospora venezuelensis]
MLSPIQLADKLGILPPTPEQAAVIEAGLEPMVVVAGAGSGKSETMAGRVVWLVANGLVRPEQVLGLTFTRKAASELSHRVRERLAALGRDVSADPLAGEPTISTYHAYAARLVTDHALREALEPTMRLITPAIAWQLAGHVVSAYDGPMEQLDWGPATVTRAVLELAGELAEHMREPQDVREVGAWLTERYGALPGSPIVAQRRPLAVQKAREQLLPLVEAYTRLKRRREVVDHGDQMALAARIAAGHPEVGRIERDRFAVVLLDEYQDTSHAQLVLLRSLFGGGHPVTAVGDPCQSIYGWRGASAGNLTRFPRDFRTASGEPAPVRRLSVSFRNGDAVLDVAARVQIPLRMEAREVPVLVPGGNRVERGRVLCAFHETAEDEARWIAGQVCGLLGSDTAPDGLPWGEGERKKAKQSMWGGPQCLQPHDVAILARKRSQFPALRRALEERGVPVEVVGLGGLLTVPEVADVVATLRVLYDPTAGDALVRLLSGPRWRIGPADLKELGERARELNRENREDGSPVTDPLDQVVAELSEERGSLVDALDELPDRPEWQDLFSPLARVRLVAMAQELRALRARAGQPLPDLITEVERRLGLDIEVAARGAAAGPFAARADLDAFVDAASRFAGDSEDPTLGAFLAFLKAADEEENGLDAGRVGESNSVKLMTVHASKGLEWPVVIVPGMSQALSKTGGLTVGTVFPARPVVSPRWTENPRKLPYPLRGDASDLPRLAGLAREELAGFDELCRDRDLLEERRLAYVAVTRAHYLLIASGYRWGSAAKPLQPSDFLLEIRETCGRVATWPPEPEEGATNPLLAEPAETVWPVTPEGARYEAVVDGSFLVEEALRSLAEPAETAAHGTPGGDGPEPAEPAETAEPGGEEDPRLAELRGWDRERARAWERDAELLLRERERNRRRGGRQVELPAHLTVSALVALAADPRALARQIRRPVPKRPAPLARRGTSFHQWLESRWGQQRLLDELELPGAGDEAEEAEALLAELRERFEESEWAGREPLDVEVPFETMIADRLVRGRMDAVFRTPDGGYEIVDWKTGRRLMETTRAAASVQLAAYRLAWSQLAGVPLERVSAAFHYVRFNETVRPVNLLDERGLVALVESVPEPG